MKKVTFIYLDLLFKWHSVSKDEEGCSVLCPCLVYLECKCPHLGPDAALFLCCYSLSDESSPAAASSPSRPGPGPGSRHQAGPAE